MKLLSIKPSTKKFKKLMATFLLDNEKLLIVHFGAVGYDDFTTIKDEKEKRKELYIKRHEKNENWNNPTTAGSLSRWVLWEKPTLEEGIKYYKKRFNL